MADRLPIVNVAGEGKELPASDTIAQSKINSLVSDLALKAPLAAPDFTGDVTFDTDVLVVDSVNNRVGVGTASPSTVVDISGVNASDDIGMIRIKNSTSGSGANTNASFIAKNDSGTFQLMQWQNFGTRLGSRSIVNTGVGDVVFTHGNDTEKMRLTANGLCFSGDTAAANALDDYEEGTWTPVLTSDSGETATLGAYTCYYTKVGRTVTININELSWTAISGAFTSSVRITGLPFTAASRAGGVFIVTGLYAATLGAYTRVLAITEVNQTYILLATQNDNTGSYGLSPAVASSGVILGLQVTYIVS